MSKVISSDLIDLARMTLMRARINKQLAEIHRDQLELGDDEQLMEVSEYNCDTAEAAAQRMRQTARSMLRQEEFIAGKQFCEHGKTNHGAKRLQGKNFQDWPEYKIQYGVYMQFFGDTWK